MRRRHAIGTGLAIVLLTVGLSAGAIPLDHHRDLAIGRDKIPNEGTSQILVIPVRVGMTAFPADRLAELKRIYDPAGGPGTFRRYWQVQSSGRFDPIPTLVEPVLYPDSCPLKDRTTDDCNVGYDDIDLLFGSGLGDAIADILERVRDEQNIDLATFDVNSGQGAAPDGHFDGIIADTNLNSGVAPPLGALGNAAVVASKPGGGGRELTAGQIALVPPNNHEFAHMLGFIDLYGGPELNGLMADTDSSLSAYSRQKLGWAEVVQITQTTELNLRPVLDSQAILQIGESPRYVLIENRGGDKHAESDEFAEGIFVYSIDEDTRPDTETGFIDFAAGDIYLPNAEPPYLNVPLPVGCHLNDEDSTSCVLQSSGAERVLTHASGAPTGYTLRIGERSEDGAIPLGVYRDAELPAPGVVPKADGLPTPGIELPDDLRPKAGSCSTGPQPSGALMLLALLFAAHLRRHSRR